MWQRPQVFVVMAGCLLSSIVPVWSQSRLPDGNRQDTVEAFSSERHKPRREEWRNVAGVGSEEAPIEGSLRPPLKRNVQFSRIPLS